MDVLALGPVEVRVNEHRYSIGGPMQRALLSRLVVAQGKPVSVAQLCEELWGEAPPRDPVHALQTRVSRLRSALPRLEIQLVNGGYAMNSASYKIDTSRFEMLREEGCGLLADGAFLQASDRLHQALSLWRGPAFSGVPEVHALIAESARLEKLRISALADRIDIDLFLGREAIVVPELAALVEENPYFERHWGQLMTALYKSGRTQEALDVYARVRTLFAELLGSEPGGDLGFLHTQILQEQPSDSLLPISILTSTSARSHRAESSQTHTKSSEPCLPKHIPSSINTKINSNDEEKLAAFLHQYRALILTGPAGIGKTYLLRAVQKRFESQYCLAPFLSASSLSQRIPLGVFAGARGIPSGALNSATLLVDSFARRRSTTMLLVDNVKLLDDSSLFVITQLINSSRIPTIMTAASINEAPPAIQDLYDSGELFEVTVEGLSDDEAYAIAESITGGPLTPDSWKPLLDLAAGNPFHLREIVSGSIADEHLIKTPHGWELCGDPSLSERLAQKVGFEHFGSFDERTREAITMVAIAGEFPVTAFTAAQRQILARTDVLTVSDNGWLRLADPLHEEVLRNQCSEMLWNELTLNVVKVLKSKAANDVPQARGRAHLLALDLNEAIEVQATIELAEQALGVFNDRLALRAATKVISQVPDHVDAHRIAGIAASAINMPTEAETYFDQGRSLATSEKEITSMALAHAGHLGLSQHDANGALKIIEETLATITDPEETQHLQRSRIRWATLSGIKATAVPAPELVTDTANVLGLITLGLSGVITGPLEDSHRVLALLRHVPEEVIRLVPGGSGLIALTETMAMSNSGDMVSTKRLLEKNTALAKATSPEAIGSWEYAQGFGELLSGDAEQAFLLAVSAVEHLKWRDSSGLLPAALALAAASSWATDRGPEAKRFLESIPKNAVQDPKVVMLRAWTDAWLLHNKGNSKEASDALIRAAEWLLAAQHTYFAGILAHCAVRMGIGMNAAAALIQEAYMIAGGGLLNIVLRHSTASLNNNVIELHTIAHELLELGLITNAVDTWMSVDVNSEGQIRDEELRRSREMFAQHNGDDQTLVLWNTSENG